MSSIKMDSEIKARWLTALRSGDYKQVQAILSDGMGSFCCLGVLCEIAVADGVVESRKTGYDGAISYFSPEHSLDADKSTLPFAVAGWAGFKNQKNPSFDIEIDDIPEEYCDEVLYNHTQVGTTVNATLAGLNDSGVPFSVIADIIEKYL